VIANYLLQMMPVTNLRFGHFAQVDSRTSLLEWTWGFDAPENWFDDSRGDAVHEETLACPVGCVVAASYAQDYYRPFLRNSRADRNFQVGGLAVVVMN
jgi:hypothetical protein